MDSHIQQLVAIKVGNTRGGVSLTVAKWTGELILVSNGLGVVGQHVHAADIKHLVKLRGGGLVLGAGDGRGDGGSGGLIGEVRLLRCAKASSG